MRAVVHALVVLTALASGCATGVPVGSRASSLAARSHGYTRASAPRTVPGRASPSPPPHIAPPLPANAREHAVRVARSLVGKQAIVIDGRSFPGDCAGLIRAVFSQVGIDVLSGARSGDNAVTAIYRYAQQAGRIYETGTPAAGDLVFFRETYDQNRDGKSNDGLTHIGVVDAVEADGTVVVIHRVQRGTVRYRMNLANPDVSREPRTGKVLNSALREPGPGRRHVLTGQLFAAFASLLPSAGSPAVARAESPQGRRNPE